jgi:heavy-metal resistance protein
MNRYRLALLVVLFIVAGAGSFVITYGSAGKPAVDGSSPSSTWLALTPKEHRVVDKADPRFSEETAGLAERLKEERLTLASLLDDASTPDARIRSQVERTIEAHNTLERRVTDHLLAIRPHLTPAQQKQMMGLVATCVRQGAQRRWRHRGGRGGGGDGQGRGRHGWRGGRGAE